MNYVPLGFENPRANADVSLFQNPAHTNVVIAFESHLAQKGVEFKIFDLNGRDVKSGLLSQTINQLIVSGFDAGTYWISFSAQEKNTFITRKLSFQHEEDSP